MSSREIAMEYRMMKWAQALQERVANGESITEFCRNRDISRNTYFYWQRKLREAACVQLAEANNLPAPVFTEVKMAEHPAVMAGTEQGRIRIEAYGLSLMADSVYPVDKLAALLAGIKNSHA